GSAAGSAAFVKAMLPDPAVAVTVPPQPLLLRPFGVDTTRLPGTVPTFAGSVSVKFASTGITFGLLMAKLTALAVFFATVAGTKVLVIFSGSRMMIPTLAFPPLPAP